VVTNTVQDWGHLRLVVGGQEATYFRDVPTVIGGWQDTDPYGSNNATLSFPQITEFDQIGTGDLAWLHNGAKVRIDLHNAGSLVTNLFFGFVDRIEVADTVTVTCAGHLVGQAALALHQPPIGRRQTRDICDAITTELDTGANGGRFDITAIKSGIDIAIRGDRSMTHLGFVDYALGMGVTKEGKSLTLLPDPAEGRKAYTLDWRDLTTKHATVSAGAHGVKVRLSNDLVDNPNVIYGEGVSTTGERWRNAKYPNLGDKTVPPFPGVLQQGDTDDTTGGAVTVLIRELWGNGDLEADDLSTHKFTAAVTAAVEDTQNDAGLPVTGVVDADTWQAVFSAEFPDQSFAQSHFAPLAQDNRIPYFKRAGDGTVIKLNPNHDPQIIKNELFVAYGESTTKRRAKGNAKALLKRAGGWAGTITLTSDPAEMSRFELRGGMNIKVDHLKGGLNQLLHISSVQVDWPSQSVTLAVSTQGRHFLDLAVRKERNTTARQDPGKHFKNLLRRSAQTMDSISGWEGESGAGIVPTTTLIGGTWNVLPVVAAEVGVMSRLWLRTSDAETLFYAAVFADKVSPNVLNNRLGDPSVWVNEEDRIDVFSHNAEWLVEDERLMVEAWGTPDQPCGLWPKPYLNANGDRTVHPVNGKHRDNGSWDFWTENNFLYLAVWPVADCIIKGRMRIQLNEGI
jgi:hypothetical protein